MTTRGAQGSDARTRILVAARREFGERGYRATTTREVARRAKVSEPTIFRQFGSKARLFEETVVAPFTAFIDRQLAGWEMRSAGSVHIVDEARNFYQEVFDLFSEERKILPALLTYYHDDVHSAASRRLENCMTQVITMLEIRTREEARVRGNIDFDVASIARIMLAMAFGLGTLPHLFDTRTLSRKRVIEEMARLTAYGTQFRGQLISSDLTEAELQAAQPMGGRSSLSPKPLECRLTMSYGRGFTQSWAPARASRAADGVPFRTGPSWRGSTRQASPGWHGERCRQTSSGYPASRAGDATANGGLPTYGQRCSHTFTPPAFCRP